MRLIDADELKAVYRMADDCKDCKTNARDCEYDRVYTKMDFCSWLDDAPTVDAVPRGAYDQVRWERDIALCQLKQLGYELGEEVVPVVYCGECKYMMPDGHCTMFADDRIRPSSSDFCSAGERKDGGT